MRLFKVFLITLLTGFYITGSAQSYGTTMGLRLGNNDNFRMVGLTVQQRIFNKTTLEGIVQTDFRHNHSAHLLGEVHKSLISKRLNFYIGAGISGGLEENTTTSYLPNETITITTYNNGTLGVDLLAGLEVTLLKLNISLDYKPNFNVVGRNEWYQGQVGISVRSVLVSGKSWRKNYKEREKARNPNAPSTNGKEYPSMGEFLNGLFKNSESE